MATTTVVEEYEETFKKGAIVEVSSEDEGLRGSWYTATVLRTISRKTHKILVEYHNLMADDAGSKPLREFVDAILLRPIPPRDPHRVFRLMDDVDAFHNDGWWEGVVTGVLEPSLRYSVFFRCSREQIDFHHHDLRLHREWVRASQWVPPLEPTPSPPHQKRRNGEDGEDRGNGNHSGVDNNRVTRNGGDGSGGRRKGNTSSKQDGLAKNGRGREGRSTGNRSTSNGAVTRKRKEREQRIGSNGTCKKPRLTRNGKLKEPRRRASNHAGRQRSKK